MDSPWQNDPTRPRPRGFQTDPLPGATVFDDNLKIACKLWNTRLQPAPPEGEPLSDAQIKHMIDRFLGWRLPKPWHPDNGVFYKRPNYMHPPADHDWPTGTNLFDYTQAEAMVRYMVEGMPSVPAQPKIEGADKGVVEAIAVQAIATAGSLSEGDALRAWHDLLHELDTKAHWMLVPQDFVDQARAAEAKKVASLNSALSQAHWDATEAEEKQQAAEARAAKAEAELAKADEVIEDEFGLASTEYIENRHSDEIKSAIKRHTARQQQKDVS